MATILADPLAESAARAEREYGLVPFIAKDENGQAVFGGGGDGGRYVQKTRQWVATILETSKAEMSRDPEIRNFSRYVDLIMGNHWTGGSGFAGRKPVVNKIAKHFWDNLANTADFRFSMEVATVSREEIYRNIATDLSTLTQANFRAQHGMAGLLFCSMFASLGIGAIKITRDREKKDVTYTPLGPDSFLPVLGNVYDFQKSGGVVHRMMKPMSWFETYHRQAYHLIKPQRPPAEFDLGVDPLAIGAASYAPWTRRGEFGTASLMNTSGDQFGVKSFATEEGCPYCEIHFRDPQINRTGQTLMLGRGNHAYKVPPRGPLYPWGRRISVAGETDPVILDDGPNMHWHGWYPFVPLRLSPVPWMWSGISDLRDLVSINNPMNRLLAVALLLAEQAGKPTVITKEGAFSAQEWADYFPGAPGGKLKLLNRMNAVNDQIQFIHPPIGVLGALATFWELLNRAFTEQSGQGSGGRLASKKQVPGAEAVQAIQETEQGRYRVKGIFTEIFFEDMGRLSMSDCAQFYDAERVISTLGDDEETIQYLNEAGKNFLQIPDNVRTGGMVAGNKFVSQFNAMMTAGSSLPARRREQANMAMVLNAAGKLSTETLYKRLNAIGAGLPDWGEERKKILLERQMFPPPQHPGKKPGAQKAPQIGVAPTQ